MAVAAHRAVESLQVAVDDEDEVVESFAGCQGDGAKRFRFIAFAVAEEAPHLLLRRVLEAAVLQVAIEAGLVNRHDGAEAHGNRGKLPVLRHEPRMRIGGKTARRLQFFAKVFELSRTESAFEIGAGVDSRRRVTLKINQISAAVGVRATEEVIETDFVEGRSRGIGRNVTADAVLLLVGAHDHGHRIPADQAFDAAFDLTASRKRRLPPDRNRVDVGCVGGERDFHTVAERLLFQFGEQEARATRPRSLENAFQRIQPFIGLGGVDVTVDAFSLAGLGR